MARHTDSHIRTHTHTHSLSLCLSPSLHFKTFCFDRFSLELHFLIAKPLSDGKYLTLKVNVKSRSQRALHQ